MRDMRSIKRSDRSQTNDINLLKSTYVPLWGEGRRCTLRHPVIIDNLEKCKYHQKTRRLLVMNIFRLLSKTSYFAQYNSKRRYPAWLVETNPLHLAHVFFVMSSLFPLIHRWQNMLCHTNAIGESEFAMLHETSSPLKASQGNQWTFYEHSITHSCAYASRWLMKAARSLLFAAVSHSQGTCSLWRRWSIRR